MSELPIVPEPWTLRDTLQFTGWGLLIFWVLFAFYFSLGGM